MTDEMLLEYETVIYWSQDDGAFNAEVPALPGSAADGTTPAEALASVQVVAREWIETADALRRAIPEPRGRPLEG